MIVFLAQEALLTVKSMLRTHRYIITFMLLFIFSPGWSSLFALLIRCMYKQ